MRPIQETSPRAEFRPGWLALAILLSGWILFGSALHRVQAEQTAAPDLPKCVVNGEHAVNFAVSCKTDEGPVFFCCNHCRKEYEAHPDKYAEAVTGQRAALADREKVQVCCPVSGKCPSPDFAADFETTKVSFCCGNCCAAFTKAPAEFTPALKNAFTYQTQCPVSGQPIDPSKVTTAFGGVPVYFCCPKCQAAFEAEPQKFTAQLESQGYKIQLAKAEPPAKEAETPATEEPAQEPAAPAVEAPAAPPGEPAAPEVVESAPLPKCPVMTGDDIELTIFETTEDGPIFFASNACRKAYLRHPDRYASGVASQRTLLSHLPKVQVTCPVSGKPIDPAVKATVEGVEVAFCCGDCCAAYTQDPAKFTKGLANAYTYQTRCPVSGKNINPAAFTEASGSGKVFFCCENCKAAFEKEPSAYTQALHQQGFTLNQKLVPPPAVQPSSETVPPAPVPGKKPNPDELKQADSEKPEAASDSPTTTLVSLGAPPCAVNSSSTANFAVSEMTDQGPAYFCCENCREKFRADPTAFAQGIESQREFLVTRTKVQVACPLSGQSANPEFCADFHGQKVSFCCDKCLAKFNQEPETFAAKVRGSFTYQTLCPISGHTIDPKVSLEVGGVQVFFCCPGCRSDFEKNPSEFASKLKEQGYSLNLEGQG